MSKRKKQSKNQNRKHKLENKKTNPEARRTGQKIEPIRTQDKTKEHNKGHEQVTKTAVRTRRAEVGVAKKNVSFKGYQFCNKKKLSMKQPFTYKFLYTTETY